MDCLPVGAIQEAVLTVTTSVALTDFELLLLLPFLFKHIRVLGEYSSVFYYLGHALTKSTTKSITTFSFAKSY